MDQVATTTLEIDDPELATIYRPIYKILSTLDHPFLVKVYSVKGKSPLRILFEEFGPLPKRSLTMQEIRGIRDAIRVLETHGIAIVRLLRENFGIVNGRVKFCLLKDAGIVSPSNPYQWKVEPFSFQRFKPVMRACDFDAYISGVYKLSEFTACALHRFVITNAALRKRELAKKKRSSRREAVRELYSIRHFLQTGNDLDKVPLTALRTHFGATEDTRQVLQARLVRERQERNRRRLQQLTQRQTKKKTFVLSPGTHPRQMLDLEVLDPILYQERPLGQILEDPDSDYRVLIIQDPDGTLRPTLYENRLPEIVYRCLKDHPWQDYLRETAYFFNIRTFEGDRYLLPKMELPRVLVIKETSEVIRLVSREAIQKMDFVGRLHCQEGAEMRLYTPDVSTTKQISAWLRKQQQQEA